jgi:hypothetical protein
MHHDERVLTCYSSRDTTDYQEWDIDPVGVRLSQPSSPKNNNEDDNTSDEQRDDQHKAQDLFLKRRHARLRIRGKLRNATEDGIITSRDTETQARATDAVRAL